MLSRIRIVAFFLVIVSISQTASAGWLGGGDPILQLTTETVGGFQADQVADACWLEKSGTVYVGYDVDRNTSGWAGQDARVDYATFAGTTDQLVIPSLPVISLGTIQAQPFIPTPFLDLLGVGAMNDPRPRPLPRLKRAA